MSKKVEGEGTKVNVEKILLRKINSDTALEEDKEILMQMWNFLYMVNEMWEYKNEEDKDDSHECFVAYIKDLKEFLKRLIVKRENIDKVWKDLIESFLNELIDKLRENIDLIKDMIQSAENREEKRIYKNEEKLLSRLIKWIENIRKELKNPKVNKVEENTQRKLKTTLTKKSKSKKSRESKSSKKQRKEEGKNKEIKEEKNKNKECGLGVEDLELIWDKAKMLLEAKKVLWEEKIPDFRVIWWIVDEEGNVNRAKIEQLIEVSKEMLRKHKVVLIRSSAREDDKWLGVYETAIVSDEKYLENVVEYIIESYKNKRWFREKYGIKEGLWLIVMELDWKEMIIRDEWLKFEVKAPIISGTVRWDKKDKEYKIVLVPGFWCW